MNDININVTLKLPTNVVKLISDLTAALVQSGSFAPGDVSVDKTSNIAPDKSEADNEPDNNEDAAADEAAAKADEAAAKKAAKEKASKAADEEGDEKKITLGDIRKALKEYATLEGKPAAVAVLNKHGASNFSDIDEDKYADIMADIE